MRYDYLIVDAGFWGSVFSREATDAGKKCLVIDKNPHLGGNCHTGNRWGINIHKYGVPIFHIRNKTVRHYVNRYATFNHYINTPKVPYRDRIFSFPINLMTLNQFWGVMPTAGVMTKLDSGRAPISSSQNMGEGCLANLAAA